MLKEHCPTLLWFLRRIQNFRLSYWDVHPAYYTLNITIKVEAKGTVVVLVLYQGLTMVSSRIVNVLVSANHITKMNHFNHRYNQNS